MPAAKNVVVAQSGGPSPVINNTVRGILDTCKMFPDKFDKIYAAWHGIEGVLKEELLDLSAQKEEEIALLRTTPAAGAIGTCRYKVKEKQKEDFNRIIEVLRAHDVGYFFYIGGNDSMDTANKVAKLAHEQGLNLVSVGGSKTIDNDVGDSEFKLVDHTPGYGSVARYWAMAIQNANEENMGSAPADPVLVIQMMGRRIGFIPAAARLADPKRRMPLQIYMPESKVSIDELTDNVNDELKRSGRCIVAVSEGFDAGDVGAARDSFGHVEFGASMFTAQQIIVNHLNTVGIPARGKARGQVAGTDQRDTAICASSVDLDESYKVGQNCVVIALEHGSGYMSTMLRQPGLIYSIKFDKVALEQVANSEREFPQAWIAESRIDVTDDFVAYARPLIGDDWVSVPVINGLQRFARLQPIFADQLCPKYVPEGYR
ncbi:diphosphate--fructose-6-phosphate 1-phosphotransferase [candidate division KSB1 bacterium]|nr:diphosphate--fructose-6-phosphate 1-phosphotransferase [candidate division KSB1 bacterium]RQW08444.1 MAG: diphosphate--fructose-6-phosphate 1-phosphotransferase [candidate division KSB1 bacterium]